VAKHKQEEHPEDVEVKEEAVETAETESVPAPTRTQKSAKATKKTTKKAPTKAAKKAASAKNVSDQLAAAHAAVTRPSTRTAGTKQDGTPQEPREKDKQAPKAATAPSATPRTPATETAQDTKETQKKPNVPQSPEDIGASYQEIPVNQIVPNPHQPRQVFDEEALAELVHSIKEFGLIHADGDHPTGTVDVIPLFETIEDLQAAAHIMDKSSPTPPPCSPSPPARSCALLKCLIGAA